MKTSGHRSLEKYTSHFIERVVCERELETEQNCNILTPTLMAITAFLLRSPGLLNRGPGAQPLWDIVLIPASSLQLQLLSRGPESPLCWVLVLSTTSFLQLLNFLSPGLYNNLTPTLLPASVTISHSIQPVHSQGYILIFLDRMHLLFTHVHFLFWQLGRGQHGCVSLARLPFSV